MEKKKNSSRQEAKAPLDTSNCRDPKRLERKSRENLGWEDRQDWEKLVAWSHRGGTGAGKSAQDSPGDLKRRYRQGSISTGHFLTG